MTHATLLLELLTEELPPKALTRLEQAFAEGIAEGLKKQNLCAQTALITSFATPRRLAVSISEVCSQAPTQRIREKVLPVAIAFDAEGQASAPLIKKLTALGCPDYPLDKLERAQEGKAESLFLTRDLPGPTLSEGLQTTLEQTISRLPIPKVMRYQLHPGTADEQDVQFIRPAHNLMALHGENIVPVTVLGLPASNTTLGHRFLSKAPIVIDHADHYAQRLQDQGKVIASFSTRQQIIREGLLAAAQSDQVLMPAALLDEVTALVEWPAIYTCQFDSAFLDVPQECLILTMQANQKYFALTNQHGQLQPRFLVVSNIATENPQAIIEGNERVIRPRLADAKFFFEQDKKQILMERLPQLANVVYHNKLGNQLQRTERIAYIAAYIAQQLAYPVPLVKRAAYLAKADLLTHMVGEFPELQGTMGRYYALHDSEDRDVALSCSEHYQPRFAGDTLPTTDISIAVALADKVETLVGIWGIGLQPTGDKDPYALRRHALGIARILLEKALPLDLITLFDEARNSFLNTAPISYDAQALHHFLLDRLRGYLREQGYQAQEIDAVLSQAPRRLDTLLERLQAVHAFAGLPEAPALAAANKRINNILKKVDTPINTIDMQLFQEDAERALHITLAKLQPDIENAFEQKNFTAALCQLAQLREPVDHFFDQVMVMAEDQKLRQNRIALLSQLHHLMNRTADISLLLI
jgi:glycyl-tRNA synthetase beta chain